MVAGGGGGARCYLACANVPDSTRKWCRDEVQPCCLSVWLARLSLHIMLTRMRLLWRSADGCLLCVMLWIGMDRVAACTKYTGSQCVDLGFPLLGS